MFAIFFVAPERAHWVTPEAAWLPPGPPWKEKEEGEPWGPWAVSQSQKDDRLEGQTVPQTETFREDPDEEDVSIERENGLVCLSAGWFLKNKPKKTTPNKQQNNSDLYLCSIKMHEQRKTKQKSDDKTPEGAVPAYLLDREGQSRAKVLSNMIKQKRKEKAVSTCWNQLVSSPFTSDPARHIEDLLQNISFSC